MTVSDGPVALDDAGYLLLECVLDAELIRRLRDEFDVLWKRHNGSVDQRQLLASETFLELLEHPRLLAEVKAVFGAQMQLLMYALRQHDQADDLRERDWHRDFSFVCDRTIGLNAIVYLDDTMHTGPTLVVPGSHRWRDLPGGRYEPRADELELPARAGQVLVSDAALWHSRGRNCTSSPRRIVLLYFGYWWLKRYEHDSALPWRALMNASAQRLQLLGLRMPGRDLHLYELATEEPT